MSEGADWSAHADKQHEVAASRRVLRAGCLQPERRNPITYRAANVRLITVRRARTEEVALYES
jgi:uncharacterized DUF497 family protein